ncbi:MAG TPA: rhomboid family intramembrane serine protease [Planctomycetaceae bacterium]|nr:rhomboid family intramembrane serine protease [Planctomycetaceae bacterium]
MSLLRPWSAPITTLSQMAMVGVFVGTFGVAEVTDRPLWELRRQFGSVEQLSWVTVNEQPPRVIEPSLSGPFDLWDGEWWRIPLSSFHHADILHLMMNISFVSYFGSLLERRWGAFRYFVLIVGACLVTALPEYLAGRYAVGYSGVGCAIFGALWALRHSDPMIATRMTNEVVVWVLSFLAGMVLLTVLEVVPVANGAHAAGVAYGFLAASVGLGPQPWRGSKQVTFALAHLGLIYPYQWVTHPTWNGKYEWYRADLPGKHGRRDTDWAGLERAVARDPALAGVWRRLADRALERDQLLEAWRLLVQGLAASPGDAELWKDCRMLWRRLCVSPDAEVARTYVKDHFKEEAENVLRELRRIIPPPVLISPGRPVEPTPQFVEADTPPEPFSWEPPPERVWPPRRDSQPSSPTRDAVEGTTL